jgi:hypothetical protein
MSEHNFDTKNCQTLDIPLQLKQRQHILNKLKEIDNQNFNKAVHIDTFQSINHNNHVITTITSSPPSPMNPQLTQLPPSVTSPDRIICYRIFKTTGS